jgi:hypothetical protein
LIFAYEITCTLWTRIIASRNSLFPLFKQIKFIDLTCLIGLNLSQRLSMKVAYLDSSLNACCQLVKKLLRLLLELLIEQLVIF